MRRHEEIIARWFSAWLGRDAEQARGIFAVDAVYSECYGPEYRGEAQILRWFEDWNKRGRVLEWRVKEYTHQGNRCASEWFFSCEYDGVIDGFDGVTLAEFDAQGRICALREFQSKHEHVLPYGEN